VLRSLLAQSNVTVLTSSSADKVSREVKAWGWGASGPALGHPAPFGSSRRDMRPNNRGVEHLDQVGRLAHRRERVEEGLEHPSLAQPPAVTD
jgi:hypothetical protein